MRFFLYNMQGHKQLYACPWRIGDLIRGHVFGFSDDLMNKKPLRSWSINFTSMGVHCIVGSAPPRNHGTCLLYGDKVRKKPFVIRASL